MPDVYNDTHLAFSSGVQHIYWHPTAPNCVPLPVSGRTRMARRMRCPRSEKRRAPFSNSLLGAAGSARQLPSLYRFGTAPPTAGPGATAARGRRWCKHSVLMSKRHLQGKSPDPNAACGRKPFGSVAQKSATAPLGTAFDKIVRSGSVWVSDKIIEYSYTANRV